MNNLDIGALDFAFSLFFEVLLDVNALFLACLSVDLSIFFAFILTFFWRLHFLDYPQISDNTKESSITAQFIIKQIIHW